MFGSRKIHLRTMWDPRMSYIYRKLLWETIILRKSLVRELLHCNLHPERNWSLEVFMFPLLERILSHGQSYVRSGSSSGGSKKLILLKVLCLLTSPMLLVESSNFVLMIYLLVLLTIRLYV